MKNFTRLERHSRIVSAAHIYQRTKDRFLIFYTTADFLVFFTVLCTTAKRLGVRILGVCPMFDHIHLLTEADRREQVMSFIREYSSIFSREMKTILGEDCPIRFEQFGCAIKIGDKKIRTSLSYLYNNPGEKGLCKRAEDYRWTFLAYAASDHPFSVPIKLREASSYLRRALKLVDYYHAHGRYMRHLWLSEMYRNLDDKEKEQLTDYIISKYNCIDYAAMISFYGSYEKACLAFYSNQGSEYDIDEDYYRESHQVYQKMPDLLKRRFNYEDIKDVLSLPLIKRRTLSRILSNQGLISRRQADKYFRIPWSLSDSYSANS